MDIDEEIEPEDVLILTEEEKAAIEARRCVGLTRRGSNGIEVSAGSKCDLAHLSCNCLTVAQLGFNDLTTFNLSWCADKDDVSTYEEWEGVRRLHISVRGKEATLKLITGLKHMTRLLESSLGDCRVLVSTWDETEKVLDEYWPG